MRAGGREIAVYNILSDGSFIMVPCLHVKRNSRDERDFFPNLEKMPCRHRRRWGEEEPSSFPGLQPPWGLELRFDAQLHSRSPLPHGAAIPQGLMLNIAPAFQTDRRAPAATPGS